MTFDEGILLQTLFCISHVTRHTSHVSRHNYFEKKINYYVLIMKFCTFAKSNFD